MVVSETWITQSTVGESFLFIQASYIEHVLLRQLQICLEGARKAQCVCIVFPTSLEVSPSETDAFIQYQEIEC